jgi:hypothetical protein
MRKGQTSRSKGQPRPHTWKAGPDPVERKKYLVWLQQKNQAQWREEGWDIPFEAWRDLWRDLWDHRGRERGTYCMSRVDWSLPWTLSNVMIITREEHSRMQQTAVNQGWRSLAAKKVAARKALQTTTP